MLDPTVTIRAAIQPTAGSVSYNVSVVCQTVTMFMVAEERVMLNAT